MMKKQITLYKSCKPYTLLLIEDHTPLKEIIHEMFTPYFHTVLSAKDGLDGWEQYIKFQEEYKKTIDIVITDINMPHKNGLELTRDIKAKNPNQVIIILSAYTQSSQLLEFINIGVEHFFTKPIKPIKLLEYIESITDKLPLVEIPKVEEQKDRKLFLDETTYWESKEKVLIQNNETIELTQYEFILMDILTKKTNFVYSVEEIIDIYYDLDYTIDDSNIRSTIFRLRKKLPKGAITAHYGRGYSIKEHHLSLYKT